MKKYILAPTLLMTLLTLSLNSMAVPAETQKIIIAAASPEAVEAGKMIARKGGNVVDVAVTVALTLAVTRTYNAGLGGGGFALVNMGEGVKVLDFRETAPKATHPKFYVERKKGDSITGGAAVGIPGIPAGLWELHKKHGKLPWKTLFKEPIRLANEGFEVSGNWARRTEETSNRFNDGGNKHFKMKNGGLYQPGQTFRQRALGKLLKKMRRHNLKAFYEGSVAKDIVETVKKEKGVLTLEDLKNYKPRWLQPLTTSFQGHTIHLMPPPSSGGIVLQAALKLIELRRLSSKKALSANELHELAEIQKMAFRGRSLLGDPDFHKNPLTHLVDDSYLKKMAKKVRKTRTMKLRPLKKNAFKGKESTETTHFSVMDNKGNAAAFTITLNGTYGSAVVTNKYGLALNNEMDDFTTRPGEPNMFGLIQGEGNYVQPGKRPLSSMSPTLVEKNGKIVMALGASGGPRIINAVLQTLYRVLVSGYNMDQAIQAPRVHHQFLPDKLFVDKIRLLPDTVKILKKRGHKIELTPWLGVVGGVRMNKRGWLEGAYDSQV